jgi:predicted transcriptional regulator
MVKAKQIGLRLDDNDQLDLKRVAQRENRTEQDVLRDSLRMYVRSTDDQAKFVESIERGWYELHSGLGETVLETDDFFASIKQELRQNNAPT